MLTPEMALMFPIVPESWFSVARQLAYRGSPLRALAELERVIDDGYLCGPVFDWDPWLEPLRSDRRFVEIRNRSVEREGEIATRFDRAGGPRLLGMAM